MHSEFQRRTSSGPTQSKPPAWLVPAKDGKFRHTTLQNGGHILEASFLQCTFLHSHMCRGATLHSLQSQECDRSKGQRQQVMQRITAEAQRSATIIRTRLQEASFSSTQLTF